MSESMAVGRSVRASDTERDEVAERLRSAAGDGRLTLTELDERLVTVYAARFRHELVEPVADLPEPVPERLPATAPGRLPLTVHAVLVVAIVAALLVRWLLTGPGFGWPFVPIAWLAVSLLVHLRVRRRWRERAS